MTWRITIPDLLRSSDYRTQAEIVHDLRRKGVVVDQSSVSRELRSLGVRKIGGVYRLPEPAETGAPIYAVDITAGSALAVVKTDPAFASVVAQAIDAASLPGVLGTIAGDDTVFVALRDPNAAARLRQFAGMPHS